MADGTHAGGETPRFSRLAVLLALAGPASAQVGSVRDEQKTSETSGGFGGQLDRETS